MQPIKLCSTAALIALVFFMVGCSAFSSAKTSEKPHAMMLEKGTDGAPNRITLTQKAVERLGLQVAQVGSAPGNKLQVPSEAVFYDSNGSTWVYANPAPLVFVRHPVALERISGKNALLSSGPAIGSSVATIGVPELQGADAGIGY
jgi:multidrug efflux pump subunit AcrA (membrane-fusion protein)